MIPIWHIIDNRLETDLEDNNSVNMGLPPIHTGFESLGLFTLLVELGETVRHSHLFQREGGIWNLGGYASGFNLVLRSG
jgi:hypothetical protein